MLTAQNHLLLLLFLVLIISCGCGNEGQLMKKTGKAVEFSQEELISIKVQNGMLVNLPGPGTFTHLRKIANKDFLILARKKSKVIEKVDLSTGNLEAVSIPTEGPYAANLITNVFWQNNDSIFVFTDKQLLHLDVAGNVIEGRTIFPLGVDLPDLPDYELKMSFHYNIHYENGHFYLPLRSKRYDSFTYPDYYQGSILAMYNYHINEIEPLDFSYPAEHDAYYGFLSAPVYHFNGNSLLFGFVFSPTIYQAKSPHHDLEKVELSSFPGLTENTPYTGATGDAQELVAHGTNNVKYLQLFQDADTGIRYRMITIPGEKKLQVKPSVLIYDQKSNLIETIVFPKYHTGYGTFLFNGKLHVPYYKEGDENTLYYRLIYPINNNFETSN